jgi:beta-glucosidase
MSNKFPDSFIWGTATASYQIEGSTNIDGRGISIWDTFSKTAGKVNNGDTGDIACDHYNRFPEDIAIMKNLGVKAYRFSISWPRLFPDGDGVREERGFEFYNKLIDALIAAEIEPMVTLYHWDLPQALENEGGWANRKVVEAFANYAQACAVAFGDRVSNWITLNEPWCTSWLGYSIGVHAPGLKDHNLAIAAAHHTALAHAAGYRAIKSARPRAVVGLTLNMSNTHVETPNDPEVMELALLSDQIINQWWISAFSTGFYPAELLKTYGDRIKGIICEGDDQLLKVTTDFLGVNYYMDGFLRSPRPEDKPGIDGGIYPFVQRGDGSPPAEYAKNLTAMGWVVTPAGLGNLMRRIHNDWPEIPYIVVTENGSAYEDHIEDDGSINDLQRTAYLTSHLRSLLGAINDGVPVKGYFAWSLLDNFEWAEGYSKRFGIVHVDYLTQKRTPKLSAKRYREIVANNSL